MKKIITYYVIWLVAYILPLELFAELDILKIALKPTENQVAITCQFHPLDSIKPSEKIIDYSIKCIKNSKDTANLVVLSTELITESTIQLLAQATLNDAIYISELRDFIVEHRLSGNTYTAQRKAILNGFFQILDLRPYTSTHKSKVGKQAILFCLFILLFLMMSIPLHYKFFFKRNNLKKYKEVKDVFESNDESNDSKDVKELCDPYTYETFQDEHDVVVIEDKILLLETWKTLFENDELKNNKDFAYLFSKKENGNFFKPSSKLYQYLHNAWFGFLSGTLAFLLFQLLSNTNLSIIEKYLVNIFDANVQISSLLINATLLGTCFGSCFFTINTLAVIPWKIFSKPLLQVLKNTLIGTILSALIFFEAALISTYFQPVFNVAVAWLFMGLNFGLLIAFLNRKHWKNGLMKGLLAGGIGFATYLFGYYLISYLLFNDALIFVWNLSFFGSLLAVGTYQTQTDLEPESAKEIETKVEDSVLSDLSTTPLQEKL